MEFMEFLMLTLAVIIIIFKPEKERWAWLLTLSGWAIVVLMYVGHVSTGILGILNL